MTKKILDFVLFIDVLIMLVSETRFGTLMLRFPSEKSQDNLSFWDKFVLAPGQIKILSLDKKLSKKMFLQKVILHRLGGGKNCNFFSVFSIRRPQSFKSPPKLAT